MVRGCWKEHREDHQTQEVQMVQKVQLDQVGRLNQEVRKHLEVLPGRKVLEVPGCQLVLKDLVGLEYLECLVRPDFRCIPEVLELPLLQCYQEDRTGH